MEPSETIVETRNFWCHQCRNEFHITSLILGIVSCTLCRSEFCEELFGDSNKETKEFVPYTPVNKSKTIRLFGILNENFVMIFFTCF